MSANAERSILHVDMDAFFAAVEQLDRPELRGRPVLVGGSPDERGVVAAASYEARPFGCHSALPMAAALRRCPQAVVVRPRMERYAELSRQVFDIFEQFTPAVEPLSIDEAFLDVTGCLRLFGAPAQIAQDLKRRIRTDTGLTASVGVAPNKFLAKLASDLQKPDGLVVVPPDGVQALLDPLPINRLWGVGAETHKRFERIGVHTFADVRRISLEDLQRQFGQAGEHFYQLARGLDERPVVTDREAKSISHETTFATDVDDPEHLRSVLLHQTERVAERLRRHHRMARTVTIKVRTPDFKTITRSATLEALSDRTDQLWHSAASLFDVWLGNRPRPVRLLGMRVAQLSEDSGRQLTLFDQQRDEHSRTLDRTIDEIRARYGPDAISRGGGRHKPPQEPSEPKSV